MGQVLSTGAVVVSWAFVALEIRQNTSAVPANRQVLRWFYAAQLRVTENRFRQFELGLIDEEALLQVGGSSASFRDPP